MLELIDLRRRFGDVVALDGVSFEVPEGRIVGFVGRNGSGKTTTMRIALGVLEADAGEVRWAGERVDAIARRRFGYMPEERGLYPKMRVHEQLVYLARLHGTPKDVAARRASELMETLEVIGGPKDRIETLSLGNQQRVQLAAALALLLQHSPVMLPIPGTSSVIHLDEHRRGRLPPLRRGHRATRRARLSEDAAPARVKKSSLLRDESPSLRARGRATIAPEGAHGCNACIRDAMC